MLLFSTNSARRSSDDGCVTIHLLKCGPLPPNKVGRIAQHIREEEARSEGRKEGMKEEREVKTECLKSPDYRIES